MRLRLGGSYAVGAIGLAAVAVWLAPWGLLALWPALALAVMAVAYLGPGPRVFRKRAKSWAAILYS